MVIGVSDIAMKKYEGFTRLHFAVRDDSPLDGEMIVRGIHGIDSEKLMIASETGIFEYDRMKKERLTAHPRDSPKISESTLSFDGKGIITAAEECVEFYDLKSKFTVKRKEKKNNLTCGVIR